MKSGHLNNTTAAAQKTIIKNTNLTVRTERGFRKKQRCRHIAITDTDKRRAIRVTSFSVI